jgi:hypothetical protein
MVVAVQNRKETVMVPQGGNKYRFRIRCDSTHNFVLGYVRYADGAYGNTVIQDMRVADLEHTVFVAQEASPPRPRMVHLRSLTSDRLYLCWADSGQCYMAHLNNDPGFLSRDASLFYFQDSDPGAWMNDPSKQTPDGQGWQKIRRIWSGHWNDARPDDSLAQALDLDHGNVRHGAQVVSFCSEGGATNQDWWVERMGIA